MNPENLLFWLSSWGWSLLLPGALLLLALVGGHLLAAGKTAGGRRLGQGLWRGSLAILLGLAVLPVGEGMLAPLERRFLALPLPERVDGIVVLGGGLRPERSLAWKQPALNEAGERVLAFALLAQRYPQARLVYSGGNNQRAGGPAEAAVVAPLLADLGIAPQRLLLETASRNTFENVRRSQALVQPQPGETWVVITSAAHMPRAIGAFRQAGWPVLPWPVDYRTDPVLAWNLRVDLAAGLESTEQGLREWLGLLAYWLTGRSSALFPAPDDLER